MKLLRLAIIAFYTILGPFVWVALFVATWPMIVKQVWRGKKTDVGSDVANVGAGSSHFLRGMGKRSSLTPPCPTSTSAPCDCADTATTPNIARPEQPKDGTLARGPLPLRRGEMDKVLARGDVAMFYPKDGNC